MRYFHALILACFVLSVEGGCKPQPGVASIANAEATSVFTPLPASTAKPVETSLFALAGFKSTGVLTVPFYNDGPGNPVFSPDGKWIASPGYGHRGVIFLWNAKTRVLVKMLDMTTQERYVVNNLVWSPDSKKIAAWLIGQNSLSPLFVWDVASGVQSAIPSDDLTPNSVYFDTNGKLITLWSSNLDGPPSTKGYITFGFGKKQEVNLKERSLIRIIPRKNGVPLALVFDKLGALTTGEPIIKVSVCLWQNNLLSRPLVEFEVGDALLDMKLSPDERTLILSGVKQQLNPKIENIDALYAACDLKSHKILWRAQLSGDYFSQVLSFSPDSNQFWAEIPQVNGRPRFSTRTGKMILENERNIPFFSPDGLRAVQRVTENRGQKPYLVTFRVFEKR